MKFVLVMAYHCDGNMRSPVISKEGPYSPDPETRLVISVRRVRG